jgi:1,4-dihydroxy-2-naphthoyl-CoA synthase
MSIDRRPAQTIGELDIHLGFLMEELREMRQQVNGMVALMATKEELAKEVLQIREEIKENSPGTFGRRMVAIAVGITSVAAATGVLVAIFRALKL